MGRLCPKGVPFSGFRYIKGQGFHKFTYMKGQENLHSGIKKGLELKQIKQTYLMTLRKKIFNNLFISRLKKVYERGAFSEQMVYKRVRGWTSGRSLPVQNFFEYPPPPGGCYSQQLLFYQFKKPSVTTIRNQQITQQYVCFSFQGKQETHQHQKISGGSEIHQT